jgi:hypothetical protein
LDRSAVLRLPESEVAWEAEWLANNGSSTSGVRAIQPSALVDKPGPVRWQALHTSCDPDLEREDYFIEVDRIRTAEDALRWTAHLMPKTWLHRTDW